jgi:hypothetical protein
MILDRFPLTRRFSHVPGLRSYLFSPSRTTIHSADPRSGRFWFVEIIVVGTHCKTKGGHHARPLLWL